MGCSMDTNDELEKLVNRSGFLFQLGVEDFIRQGFLAHRWEVLAHEYPWFTHDRTRSGFIDLITGNDNLRCVFECKRTQAGEWIFIVPTSTQMTIELRTLWAIVTKIGERRLGWDDLAFTPATFRSEFCIVRGASDDDKPMLERVTGDLVRAAESLAREELDLHAYHDGPYGYIPVLVTNTTLVTCFVDPAMIDRATGFLPKGAKFEEVGAIRFRKALPTDVPHGPTYSDIRGGIRKKERSAFVVNTNYLATFLAELHMNTSPSAPPSFALPRIVRTIPGAS